MGSPQNQCRWEFEGDIDCALPGKEEASVAHILAGFQRRYKFYHNVVSLRVIAHEMQVMINQVRKEVGKVDKDYLVKEGEQRKTSSRK